MTSWWRRSGPGDPHPKDSAPPPVGHLVHHQDGIQGTPGVGYDYVMARDGIYVQAHSDLLDARILAAPCTVRGLANSSEKLEMAHGPIPADLFCQGLAWMLQKPRTERLFRIAWRDGKYHIVIPEQQGASASLSYSSDPGLEGGTVAEFHSHGSHDAFFSETDDEDEQGFRIYGVVGKLDTHRPRLALRIGIYGHFAPVKSARVFEPPITVSADM